MKCYFVRHGQTAFNKEGKIMGQLDEPLDETGIEEARELAEKLDSDFEILFSSPLLRAKKTAEIINEKLNLPMEIRNELHERNFGNLAGKTIEEMNRDTLDDIKKKDDELVYDYRPYGGESVGDVKARLEKFILFLKNERTEKKALVVTHTGIIMLMYLIHKNIKPPIIENGSVHIFEI